VPFCGQTRLESEKALVLGPISRILFLPLARDSVVISLGRLRGLRIAATGCPAERSTAAYPRLWDGPPSRLFCLAPDGVFRAADVAVGAVGSYPTFSPSLREVKVMVRVKGLPPSPSLSLSQTAQQFIFCDTVRHRGLTRGARAWSDPCAASCPMVSGLSSPNLYRARRYPHLGIKELGATTRPQN
jgi:hypothetical protein